MARAGALVNGAMRRGLDLLWPPRSLASDAPVHGVSVIEVAL
jgi:hypothetical protein